MLRKAAKGNSISPDPWGDDDDDDQTNDVQMQPSGTTSKNGNVTQVFQADPPPSSPTPKPPVVPVTVNRKKEKKRVQITDQFADTFVYQSKKGSNLSSKEVEQYFNRAHNSNVRRPYLWERKRDLLLAGKQSQGKGCTYNMKLRWNSFKIGWRESMYSLEVWKHSMKRIEGHQGTGVVSYFVFLRWLFFLNLFIFFLLFWVIVFFQVAFPIADYDKDTTGSDSSSTLTGVILADTCSAQYLPNVTYESLNLFLDFLQGTGWMETTAMFYGYYTNKEMTLAVTEYNMPLAYLLSTIFILLLSIVVMVRNTIGNFTESVLAFENSKTVNYCSGTFAAWDFSIAEDEAMLLKQQSIHYMISSDLCEQRYERERQKRTQGEKCSLYTIRFFINFLILLLLGGAGAAIYFAQDFASTFTNSSDAQNVHALVLLLVEFLPSIVIGLLNGILPFIFEILVEFEKYRPNFVIKISLIRTVFLRLASLAMIIATLYVNITCSSRTSCLVGTNSCPAIQCWETYVGSTVYKLLVLDFFIDIAFTLGVELPRKLLTTKCSCGICAKIGPAVFDIPKNVLDLVYAQTLCWLGFFFAPLLPAIIVFRFFCLFYLKKLSALYNTIPAERPYQASRSNTFFMVILMISFAMICIPLGYVLVGLDPSPMCGPFRIYDTPVEILTIQVNNAAYWFQVIWNFITSAAFVSATIIILALTVYYFTALISAKNSVVDLMKEQLILEGRDKQFLLVRLSELTGGKPVGGGGKGQGQQQSFQQQQRNNVSYINESNNQDNLGVEYQNPAVYEPEAPPPAFLYNTQGKEDNDKVPHYTSPGTNFDVHPQPVYPEQTNISQTQSTQDQQPSGVNDW